MTPTPSVQADRPERRSRPEQSSKKEHLSNVVGHSRSGGARLLLDVGSALIDREYLEGGFAGG